MGAVARRAMCSLLSLDIQRVVLRPQLAGAEDDATPERITRGVVDEAVQVVIAALVHAQHQIEVARPSLEIGGQLRVRFVVKDARLEVCGETHRLALLREKLFCFESISGVVVAICVSSGDRRRSMNLHSLARIIPFSSYSSSVLFSSA